MRRCVAVTFALVMLTSSCSKFAVQSDVRVNRVSVDLAFGKAPKAEPTYSPIDYPQEPLTLPTPTIPDLTFDEPEPELCPPVKAVAARDIAVDSVTDKQMPKKGDYLYMFLWNYAGEAEHARPGIRTVSNIAYENDQFDPSKKLPNGFSFTVEDAVDPVITLGLESHLQEEPAANSQQTPQEQQDNDGLFFKSLYIPAVKGKPDTIPFIAPQQQLKLMDYPITQGAQFTKTGPDGGLKPGTTRVPNPVPGSGGYLPDPGQGTIQVTTTVGAKEIIAVCAELAQAWKVNVSIKATEKDYNFDLEGTFWFDTAYGGLPVRQEYSLYSSDESVISGNFFSQMMKLDPGEYI